AGSSSASISRSSTTASRLAALTSVEQRGHFMFLLAYSSRMRSVAWHEGRVIVRGVVGLRELGRPCVGNGVSRIRLATSPNREIISFLDACKRIPQYLRPTGLRLVIGWKNDWCPQTSSM